MTGREAAHTVPQNEILGNARVTWIDKNGYKPLQTLINREWLHTRIIIADMQLWSKAHKARKSGCLALSRR